ncbi:hypothetical protein, partial [Pontiella sp.]|uniref:hypothetical protein n=1 Tax=Pontiella sp. TaxID=2837462 RepID=UPI003562468B
MRQTLRGYLKAPSSLRTPKHAIWSAVARRVALQLDTASEWAGGDAAARGADETASRAASLSARKTTRLIIKRSRACALQSM